MMRLGALLPGLAMSLPVTAAMAVARLRPSGEGFFLVHVGSGDAAAILSVATRADAAVVEIPQPGLVVLAGHAAAIHAAAGPTMSSTNNAPCFTRL